MKFCDELDLVEVAKSTKKKKKLHKIQYSAICNAHVSVRKRTLPLII